MGVVMGVFSEITFWLTKQFVNSGFLNSEVLLYFSVVSLYHLNIYIFYFKVENFENPFTSPLKSS